MSIGHTLSFSLVRNSTLSASISVPESTAGQEINLNESIPQSSTDLVIACVIDQSQLKSLVITIDKAATVVAKASGGSTVNTWVFEAGGVIVWNDNMPNACPLSNDIATLEVTTGAVGTAVLQVFALIDPTV